MTELIIISYDISNDKKEQDSINISKSLGTCSNIPIYEIDNSERILNNIVTDLNNKWLKQFDQTDSVYIFNLSNSCKIENTDMQETRTRIY